MKLYAKFVELQGEYMEYHLYFIALWSAKDF